MTAPPPLTEMTVDDDNPDPGARMALVVRLAGEALGLPVTQVGEVIDPVPRTRVPGAGDFAPWLINVRGAVVPLVDVRRRLNMPARDAADGRIVVLDMAFDGQAQRLAMLADAVEEVIDYDPARIEALPPQGAPWPDIYLKGAIRRADDLVLILDADALFRPDGGAAQNP